MLPLLLSVVVLSAAPAPLADTDRFLQAQGHHAVEPSTEPSRAWMAAGAITSTEPRLGVPTFVFVPPAPAEPELQPADLALKTLAAHRDLWRLDASDLRTVQLKTLQDLGVGPRIARFVQRIDGIEVFRAGINAAMDRSGNVISLSGYVAPHSLEAAAHARRASLSGAQAAAMALSDLADATVTPEQLGVGHPAAGGYVRFTPDSFRAGQFVSPPRIKRVFYLLADGLEPAWYVEGDFRRATELQTRTESYVISASDGSLLYRHNATSDVVVSYRVWADTSGIHAPWDGPQGTVVTPKANPLPDGTTPAFVAPNLVTLDHGPIANGDPWLPAGATVTFGNNVQAYSDLSSPDGYDTTPDSGGPPDVRPDMIGPNAFDRIYDVTQPPNTPAQQKAAVVQMFYDLNFMHDWYYDVGFKEVDGNAQLSNYGRGGVEGDVIHAEGEDYSGRNNANMSTQSDGASPRMQMYVWDGPTDPTQNELRITAPAAIAGSYLATFGGFGAQQFDLIGQAISANTTAGLTDGCAGYANGVFNQKIAYIDRGSCAFVIKVKNAQNAGALGVIIGSNSTNPISAMGGTDPTITIPSMLVEQATGASIKANVPVSVRMLHFPGIDRDGTIDTSVIAHEWNHYVSNRLVGDANGLGTNFARGLGEGWSDTNSMMVVVRAGDDLVPSNATWNGVYPLAVYDSEGSTADASYYGIRRYPYSTDLAKNPLTYKHVQDGIALPTTTPAAGFGQDGAQNSEVHSTGEVWAAMLWECYAAFLRDTQGLRPRFGSFTAAQDRFRLLLVASYKLCPVDPTLLEARDALIAAAAAGGFPDSSRDVTELWIAFAKRGAGTGATSPDRADQNQAGALTESNRTDGAVSFVSATLTEDAASSCDHDGILGVNETGTLNINVRNTGAQSLSASRVTVATSTPGVSFAGGGVAPLPSTRSIETAATSIQVTLSGITQPTEVPFTFTVSDTAVATPSSGKIYAWVAAINGRSVSTVDDAEETQTNWTAKRVVPAGTVDAGPDDFAWHIQANSGPGHVFFGPDSPHTNDQSWVSPPLQVAATGNLSFSFKHRYALETGPGPTPDGGSATAYYDGAVLELSSDNGTTWTDIGASASPGYSQTIFTDPTGAPGGNALAGRRAYAGKNAQWPALDPVTVSLGTAYQGKSILIRFRVGSDQGGIDYGWEVDDVSFTGLTNTPFNHLIADSAACTIGSSGSTGTSGSGSTGATGTVGTTGSTGSTSSGSGTGRTAGSSGSTGTTGGSKSSGCGCGAGNKSGLELGALCFAALAMLARRRRARS
jgi:hypothetical protein